MRFRQPKHPRDSDPSLIPLINVVLLLLIFFMLAGQIAPIDTLPWNPPRSDSRQVPPPSQLVILIDRSGQARLAGQPVDAARFEAHLREALAAGSPTVRIKADGDLNAQRLIELLERLRHLGADEIDLLTLTRDGE